MSDATPRPWVDAADAVSLRTPGHIKSIAPECGFADLEKTVSLRPTVARYDIGDPDPEGWSPVPRAEQKANAALIVEAVKEVRGE